MPRTTLDLDASVLEQLRHRAATEHKSMGQVASERLAIGLGEATSGKLHPLGWPSKQMGTPRIDIEDKDALWRALDEWQPDPGTQLDSQAR
ncbi:MAG TPA: hypothetical protein VGL37_00445 [Solirubrobacteraceae bacterium]|jgi:hypothetical protein